MRLALITLLATTTLSLCERRNPQFCDDDLGISCAPGMHCEPPSPQDGGPRCVPNPLPPVTCQDNGGCPTDQPICASGLCRPCLPGEDSACMMRDSSTPRCSAGRCVQCSVQGLDLGSGVGQDPDCPSSSPVCDNATSQCRPCRLHGECTSGVCAKDAGYEMPVGSCVPADQVVVVDPLGCQGTGPIYCTPAQAIAQLGPSRRFVVVRRSAMPVDFSKIAIGSPGISQFIIGPMADIPPEQQSSPPAAHIGMANNDGFDVTQHSKVTIEGFYIQGASIGVRCSGGGPNDSDTQVRVLRSMLSGNQMALVAHDNCHLIVEQSWIGKEPDRGIQAVPAGNAQSFEIIESNFDIINSVITGNSDENNDIPGGIHIVLGLGSSGVSTVVNSLFYDQPYAAVMNAYTTILCDNPLPPGRLVVLNSMFFQKPTHPSDHYIMPSCNGQYLNIATDEQALAGTDKSNIYVAKNPAGPGWADVTKRDFHLMKATTTKEQQQVRTGGTVQVMVDGQTVSAPSVDMDGVQRPNASVAIGPFEPSP